MFLLIFSINKRDWVLWRTLTSLMPSNYSFRSTLICSEDITCWWFSSAASSWLLRLFDFAEWELLEVFFDSYVLGKHILFGFFLHELAWLICSDILSFFCFFLEHYKSDLDFFEGRSCWFFNYLLYFFSDFYLFLGLLWCLIYLWFRISSVICSNCGIFCIVIDGGCISASSSFGFLWSYFGLFILILFMVVLILIVVGVLNIFYFVDFDVESHFVFLENWSISCCCFIEEYRFYCDCFCEYQSSNCCCSYY